MKSIQHISNRINLIITRRCRQGGGHKDAYTPEPILPFYRHFNNSNYAFRLDRRLTKNCLAPPRSSPVRPKYTCERMKPERIKNVLVAKPPRFVSSTNGSLTFSGNSRMVWKTIRYTAKVNLKGQFKKSSEGLFTFLRNG